MAIATRFPKSSAIPKFDIKDPSLVLYIPLWYPDSETTGSTIISKDKNRYSCTVTEATWGAQGRTFDGINDILTFGNILNIGQSDYTFDFWLKAGAEGGSYFEKPVLSNLNGYCLEAYSTNIYGFLADGTTSVFGILTAKTNIQTNTWMHLVWTIDYGTDERLYQNGVQLGNTVDISSITGSITNTRNFTIGGVTDGYPACTVGEFRAWNRLLTNSEIMRIYQVTKWRY